MITLRPVGFALASVLLMYVGLSAQSAEQQIVADAATALGGCSVSI